VRALRTRLTPLLLAIALTGALTSCSDEGGSSAEISQVQPSATSSAAAPLPVRPTDLVARLQSGDPDMAKGDQELLAIQNAANLRCGIRSVGDCYRSSELMSDPGFRRSAARFLGNRRATYLYDRPALVREQMLEVLGGAPDEARMVGDFYAFSGCRYQSCDEKGAVILEADGTIRAVAILHYFTAEAADEDRYSRWNLDIYSSPIAESEAVHAYLQSWAESAVAELSDRPFGRMTVIDIPAR
jgi:hypothetical protein